MDPSGAMNPLQHFEGLQTLAFLPLLMNHLIHQMIAVEKTPHRELQEGREDFCPLTQAEQI